MPDAILPQEIEGTAQQQRLSGSLSRAELPLDIDSYGYCGPTLLLNAPGLALLKGLQRGC
jgi:hypothetical protein